MKQPYVQPRTLYTIGHSNRSLNALIALVSDTGIKTLVDVRATPHSSRYPHFSGDSLRRAADAAGVIYHWAGHQLGGRRAENPDSQHVALEDAGLRAYADYMDSTAFQTGAVQLINLTGHAPTAILCAERDPLYCHRSLIADYLVLQGTRVVHLIDAEESREHHLRPEARRESARLIYDRNTTTPIMFS